MSDQENLENKHAEYVKIVKEKNREKQRKTDKEIH